MSGNGPNRILVLNIVIRLIQHDPATLFQDPNSVDLDETGSKQSDLGLHFLVRSVHTSM